MPRGRKRKDPDDAPVDGDYRKDVVLNKDPSKRYMLVCDEEIPVMKGRGAVRTERTEDGARPAYDMGGDGGYMVGGQLTLMEMPEARAVAIQKNAERAFAQSMTGLREDLASTKRSRYGSLGPSPGHAPEFRVEN